MGDALSCHQGEKDTNRRQPNREGKDHKRHLSAVCNFSEVLVRDSRININTAREEELMTLPGITRFLAHNIVVYREKIGGFRKVEDAALVTGVGATKLQLIKSEICVTRGDSSKAARNLSSFDLVSSTKLNINVASETQLTAVQGVSENLANDIVLYRTANGPFAHVDHLLRVPGVDVALLNVIQGKLTVSLPRPASSNLCLGGESRSNLRLSFYSLQHLNLEGQSQTSLVRPLLKPFTGQHNGRPVVRIGSWNLQNLTLDKVNNPGVREVICLTLLENGIKLLAIQEVLHEDALDKICLELEKPTIATVQEWTGDRGRWKYVVLDTPMGEPKEEVERVGFLWDSSFGVELDRAISLEKLLEPTNGHRLHSPALLGRFKIAELPISLINVHLKTKQDSGTASGAPRKPLGIETLRLHLKDNKHLVILGHFGLQPDAREFDVLRENHFHHCIPEDIFTNISTKAEVGGASQDNIWWNEQAQGTHTGRSGVIRQGLSSPWIPDGWKWGGVVSEHCPVWTEIFID
eukprot:gi/632975106/ref/XP_007904041.1/ PREDICTED: endonuclease/exonuclease/phosphatase family domain-containing protein 1-like [Callorhinchus milii]